MPTPNFHSRPTTTRGEGTEERSEAYANYQQWKDWDIQTFMNPAYGDCSYYERELRGIPLSGRQVLEIGFGNGAFLAWARQKGAAVSGTEVIPALVAAARTSEVEVLDPDLSKALPTHAGRFDLIVAFDVLEHIAPSEMPNFLRWVIQLLSPGGIFVARFPNSQSPFGSFYQCGDITHVSRLSPGIGLQLLLGTEFEILRIANAAVAGGPGWLGKYGVSTIRRVLQRLVELTICFIYGFPDQIGPNSVLVARRPI